MDLFDSTLISKFHPRVLFIVKHDLNALLYVTCNQETEMKHFLKEIKALSLRLALLLKNVAFI